MNRFSTYVIYNKDRNKIYIGQTQDAKMRLKRHNGLLKNKVKSFTSKIGDFLKLVYKEEFSTRKEAIIGHKI